MAGRRGPPKRLSELNPQAKVVAVLDDITSWRPVPDASVVRRSVVPAGAALYMAYQDGLWPQGGQDNQMYAIDAEHAELAPAWGGVSDVQEFATKVEKAATGG